MVGGLLLMWLVLAVDYHSLLHYVPVLYIGVGGGAAGDGCWSGTQIFGSKRWIPLPGGIHLQVSEFVKLVIILLVARYLTDLKTDELEIREMAEAGGAGGGSHGAGAEAAGPGDVADLSGSPGRGSVSRGIAVEVCGRHRRCGGAGASGRRIIF